MSNCKLRRICFTLNNYNDEDIKRITKYIEAKAKFGIFGKEIGENGTPHLQGFINLKTPERFRAVKNAISDRAHIEKAMGTDTENQRYCSKSDEYYTYGEPSFQGKRNDLHEVIKTIQGGEKNIKVIAEKHPGQFIKYHRGIITWLHTVYPIQPRNFKTEVYYYWGEPGTGKSRRALQEANDFGGNIYYKPRGDWWDGYQQHDNVIIDDFYGWLKYDDLLKICDRYPYKVPVKGGYEEFVTKRIWITSNVDTCDLYKFYKYNKGAFERRITIKINI